MKKSIVRAAPQPKSAVEILYVVFEESDKSAREFPIAGCYAWVEAVAHQLLGISVDTANVARVILL